MILDLSDIPDIQDSATHDPQTDYLLEKEKTITRTNGSEHGMPNYNGN